MSQATRQELIDTHGFDADRIMVTPEVANVTPKSPSNDRIFERLALEGPYVLSVGTIEPRKNQVRLVQAFVQAGAALAEHALVLAGIPGWGQEQVQTAIDNLGVSHRVTLTGKVTNLDLAALYSRADVFAIPSLYEGFGIPLLEAMSFGIPAVAGSTPALAELAGETALLVEPTDTDALAGKLAQLATDKALRERLSTAARQRAAGYSWEETTRLTLQAYRRAAE
ncbi:hypothetical protein BH23ACT12_BH23ACT12_03280 [soil metagenome]